MDKRLFQTLADPSKSTGATVDFSRFPREDREALAGIAAFGYIDRSELKSGAVVDTLQYIATHRDEYKLYGKVIHGIKFFILISLDSLGLYAECIEAWSQSNHSDGEYHGMLDAVTGNPDCKILGWLDIKDHVIFFVDKEMAERMDQFLVIEQEKYIKVN